MEVDGVLGAGATGDAGAASAAGVLDNSFSMRVLMLAASVFSDVGSGSMTRPASVAPVVRGVENGAVGSGS